MKGVTQVVDYCTCWQDKNLKRELEEINKCRPIKTEVKGCLMKMIKTD